VSSAAPPAIQASLRASAPQITGPPHVRGALDVPGAMRCVIVAALPCVGMAIYNAGYQARSAPSAGLANAGDWRLGAFEALGVPATSTQAWVCVAHGAAILLPLLVAALLAGGLAERLFAHFRQRDVDHTALGVIALLFTLCLPPSIPLWQAALGGFIAVAVGKEIFGGFGLNFVNPPLVGLAFLYFAYPGALAGDAVRVAADGYTGATPLAAAQLGGLAGLDAAGWTWLEVLLGRVPGALGETSALACTLGLAVLLYTGVASWRVVTGGALGLVAMAVLIDAAGATPPIAALPWYWHAVTDGFAFGLVFLATDPVTAPVTNSARWLYGLLIGSLVVLLRVANPAQSESVLLAVLLGNVMAPLLDQIAARTQMWRRSRADGR
jgi:Na+-transporting NADH:ubiquinone oxidoreductase subunit B